MPTDEQLSSMQAQFRRTQDIFERFCSTEYQYMSKEQSAIAAEICHLMRKWTKC